MNLFNKITQINWSWKPANLYWRRPSNCYEWRTCPQWFFKHPGFHMGWRRKQLYNHNTLKSWNIVQLRNLSKNIPNRIPQKFSWVQCSELWNFYSHWDLWAHKFMNMLCPEDCAEVTYSLDLLLKSDGAFKGSSESKTLVKLWNKLKKITKFH